MVLGTNFVSRKKLLGSHETSPTKQPTEQLDDDNTGSDRSYDDDNAIVNVIIE